MKYAAARFSLGVFLAMVSLFAASQTRGSDLISTSQPNGASPATADSPAWAEQSITASDGAAGDMFGISSGVWGNTGLVGSPHATINGNAQQGAVYVFTRTRQGWMQVQKLSASNGNAEDQFGHSLAVFGTTAVIGATGPNSTRGAVYVFTNMGGIWVETQVLTASDGIAGDEFGQSVAFDGKTILVGASLVNSGRGAGYIFVQSGGQWTQVQKLTAPRRIDSSGMGRAVAISGNTALLGAPYVTSGGYLEQGVVFVFTDLGGNWTLTQEITGDGIGGDWFGWSVAVDGVNAIVGGPLSDENGQTKQGAAFSFVNANGSWMQTSKLTARDGAALNLFGWSVAISGTDAIVSAPYDERGGAYIFTQAHAGWYQNQKITPAGGAAGELSGWSVAVRGRNALLGTPFADRNGRSDQGEASFFQKPIGNFSPR